MHLYQSSPVDAARVSVYLNDRSSGGPFAVIRLGSAQTTLHVHSPEEADALIAAAVEAKRLLDPPVVAGAEESAACMCAHRRLVHAGAAPFRCLHNGCGCETFRAIAPAGPGGVLVGPFDETGAGQ